MQTFKLLEPTSSSSSTDKVILDYLLYISIQARLRQANRELDPPSPSDKVRDHVDVASQAERDKKAVESIVAGILSSYHIYNSDPTPFQQRLHLYLLSNHTLGRYNALSSDHVIVRRRKLDKDHDIFSNPLTPLYCRRHRRQCDTCPARTAKKKSGLMDAIPIFLKTSADLLRRALDNTKDAAPMVFAGQKVMGGGMPPRWYDLFLSLLTQAAIECYVCDGQQGPEPIFEIFSYGYVEDEDEEDDSSEDETDTEDEEEWNVRAADHHLLFPKTRTMFLFKTQVREREKEFLIVNKDHDLRQHFDKLALRYPLLEFEKSMYEFIHMVSKSMDVPALDKYGEADVASIVYRYPSDGSLLMPEVSDDESIYVVPDQSSPPSSSSSSSSLAEEEAAAVTAIACASSLRGLKRAHQDEPEQQVPRKRIAH